MLVRPRQRNDGWLPKGRLGVWGVEGGFEASVERVLEMGGKDPPGI